MRFILAFLIGTLLSWPAFSQDCPDIGWHNYLSPGEQTWTRHELIEIDGNRDMVSIVFDTLQGDYAKVFMFLEYRKDGCLLRAVSHGSYGYLGAEQGVVYHLDLYSPGFHSTLYIGEGQLTYEAVRAQSLEVFGEE